MDRSQHEPPPSPPPQVDTYEAHKQLCADTGKAAEGIAQARDAGTTLAEVLAIIGTMVDQLAQHPQGMMKAVILQAIARKVYAHPTWTPQEAYVDSYYTCVHANPQLRPPGN